MNFETIMKFDFPKHIYTYEPIDERGLYRLINTRVEYRSELLDMLRAMVCVQDHDSYLDLEWKKSNDSEIYGRYFASGSLITQKRIHRSIIAPSLYYELDLKSSNPALLANLLSWYGIDSPKLWAYITNRDEIHLRLKEICPEYVWQIETPKSMINSSLNGGFHHWDNTVSQYIPTNSDLYQLMDELKFALEFVWARFSRSVPWKNESISPKGSLMSNILLTIESYVIYHVMNALVDGGIIQTNGARYICGLAYDGLFIPLSPIHDVGFAEQIANDEIERLGFRNLIMRMKNMEHGVQCVEYVGHSVRVPRLDQYGTKMAISYPTGQGKTFASLNYALNHFANILVIVHRQTLASDIAENYPQFKSYLGGRDYEPTYEATRQIICLNSLAKLRNPKIYECIIIDEFSSVLQQCVCMKIDHVSIKMLEVYLKTPSRTVIVMDALLSDTDFDLLQRQASYVLISPVEMNPFIRICTILGHANDAKRLIVESVAKGERICIPYSTDINKMEGMLRGLGVKYLNVHRNTRGLQEIQSWVDYQVVAFSPTMDSGVDVTFRDECNEIVEYFDKVIAIITMQTISPRTAVQMLGRVRHCRYSYIAYSGPYNQRIFEDEREFNEWLQARLTRIANLQLDLDIDDDFNANIQQDFRYQLTWNYMRARKEIKKYETYLRFYLIRNQWSLRTPGPELINTIGQCNLSYIEREERQGQLAWFRQVAQAPIITTEEAAKLKERRDLSQTKEVELLAYNVVTAFALDIDRPQAPTDISPYERFLNPVWTQYIQSLQEHQYSLLYPYGNSQSNGDYYEYIQMYLDRRGQFYRQKFLVNMNNNPQDPQIPFYLHKESFMEKSIVIHKVLVMMGFVKLDTVVRGILNMAQISTQMNIPDIDKYILDNAGIRIKTENSVSTLVSTIASADPRMPGAFYIRGLPIPYADEAPQGFTFVSIQKLKCLNCFKKMKRLSARRHSCRPLPPGIIYRETPDGAAMRWCITCRKAIRTNVLRHARLHT